MTTTARHTSPFDAHDAVVTALADIAPDIDAADLDADLHDDLGLDSVDLLNLTAALATSTGVDIPDRDVGGLRTIRRVAAYLDAHR